MTDKKSELLQRALALLAEKNEYHNVDLLKILSSGDTSERYESDIPKGKVRVFMSSTFDDTKFEQDEVLNNAYSFLKKFCQILTLDFDIVSMRWGVNARSGALHQTSELCMDQLRMCLQESMGPAFVT